MDPNDPIALLRELRDVLATISSGDDDDGAEPYIAKIDACLAANAKPRFLPHPMTIVSLYWVSPPENTRDFEWSGTLVDWIKENPQFGADADFTAYHTLLTDLAMTGEHRGGGGAEAEWVLRLGAPKA
jgi:hypothetical protein